MYVGNLAYGVTESDLRAALEAFGAVESVNLVKDKVTGEPIGFALVEMADRANARAAIAGLNGKKLRGRELAVNLAQAGLEVHRRKRRPGVERPD
jgi:cold-inducible RNA-binding protein